MTGITGAWQSHGFFISKTKAHKAADKLEAKGETVKIKKTKRAGITFYQLFGRKNLRKFTKRKRRKTGMEVEKKPILGLKANPMNVNWRDVKIKRLEILPTKKKRSRRRK